MSPSSNAAENMPVLALNSVINRIALVTINEQMHPSINMYDRLQFLKLQKHQQQIL